MRIYLRYPNGKHKSFALIKREGKKNTTIKNKDLDALNVANLPPDIKLKYALAIKKQVEREHGIATEIVHNEDNKRILEKYWNEKYRRRDLVDPATAKYELQRSVRALGNLSLLTATAEQIEDALKTFSNNKRRRMLGKIQLILRFLGRNLELVKPAKEDTKVAYITAADFNAGLARIEDPFLRALFNVLFHTGMRLGEAFGLNELKIRNGYILVDTQLDKHERLRKPKNRKTRKAFVRDMKVVKEWLQIKNSVVINRTTINKYFKKYFPHLTIHDLRHSYAIGLLSKGVPIAHVAQSLGNSVRVCEEHYTGFELVDESIEYIKKLVN